MTQTTRCPHCRRGHEKHFGDGTPPTDGDVSICWGCGRPGMFTITPHGVLTIRKPTDDELDEIDKATRPARAAMAESYTPAEAAALAFPTNQPHAS